VRGLAALALCIAVAAAADTLEQAERGLVDDDPDLRLAAAGRLGGLGAAAAPAVPLLAEAAYDEDDLVARAAVDALGRIGPEAREAMESLRGLAVARPVLQSVVERALRATGGGSGGAAAPARRPPGIPADTAKLLPLVDDPRPSVRMPAVWALTLDHSADPIFLKMLRDPSVRRRRTAARHVFGPGSLPQLREALEDDDLRVRQGVIRALGNLGADAAPALDDLLAMLDESDPALATSFAFVSLGRLAPDRVVPALIRQLAAPHPICRSSACSTLGQLGAHAAPAVPALTRACFDEDPQVVSTAISALAKLGPVAKEAAPYLLELFDADPGFGEFGRRALLAVARDTTLPPPPDPLDVESLEAQLKDPDARTAGFAAFTLGRVGAKDSCDALGEALEHKDPVVRKQAALALQRIGPPSLGVLERVAKEGRGPARRLAAAVLPRLAGADPDAVLPVALGLLGDEDPYVCTEAIRAVGIIGPPAQEAAAAPLLHCLEGEHAWMAAWALGCLHVQAAVPRLVKLLDLPRGEDPRAVSTAVLALGEIGPAAESAIPALVAEARRPDDTHFQDALDALVRMGAAGQAEVVDLIRDEDGLNRNNAIVLLMALDLHPPGLKEALDAAAKDPDSNVRQSALLAARGLETDVPRREVEERPSVPRDPRIEKLVAAAKAEPSDRFRWSHLPETLAEIATVADLLAVARETDVQVRWIAWSALSHKRRRDFTEEDAKRALPMLIEALDDPKVADAAATSVHVVPLGPPDPRFLRLLLPAPGSRWFDSYAAEQIAKALHARGPEIVPAMAEALRNDDGRIRAGAASVLEGFGPEARAAVPALRAAALRDADAALPFVRAIIAAADLETIATLFVDTAMPLRTELGAALAAAGKDALPYLDALRQHDDPAVRHDTVLLLPRCLGVPLDWRLKAAGDEDDNVATAALAQLGEGVPAEQAIPVLARAAQDDALRRTALHVLVARGADGLTTLTALAEDPSPKVRAAALEALGGSGAAAMGILAEALRDREPEVRVAGADALGALGADAKRAIPTLRALLRDPDGRVRRAAAATLGKLRDEDAVPDLLRLFGSADASDRRAATLALASIGEKGASALAPFLAHPDATLRDLARSALASMGNDAVPALAALLAGEDANARREARGVLAKIGEPAVEALRGALHDKTGGVRLDAAWALGTMKARAAAAAPDLILLLEDPDPLVVPQAAWALGRIGPAARDALPALEKLLEARKHGAIVADAIRRIRGS